MDGESFAHFDQLRRQYYPPERNTVPAHVTLFYRLPGGQAREIKALLAQVAAKEKAFPVVVGEVKAMERGVGILLYAPQLSALREALAAEWWPWLTDQDRSGFQPHVTIQNNVSAGEARQTRRTVLAKFHPPRLRALGLHLWRYRDGRWEHEQLFRFR
jgi:2'-5' RNA ligase